MEDRRFRSAGSVASFLTVLLVLVFGVVSAVGTVLVHVGFWVGLIVEGFLMDGPWHG